MNRKVEYDISRKGVVLNHAIEIGNIAKTCRETFLCVEEKI